MKRTPLKRTGGLTRRTPLKTKKRRSWPTPQEMGRTVCEVQLDTECTRFATDSHHIILRSRGGSDDPSNLVAACRSCHGALHANPANATDRGFMRHGWERA